MIKLNKFFNNYSKTNDEAIVLGKNKYYNNKSVNGYRLLISDLKFILLELTS